MKNNEPSSNSCKFSHIHLLLNNTGIYEFSFSLTSDGLLSRPDYLKNICIIQEYFLGLCNQRIFEKKIKSNKSSKSRFFVTIQALILCIGFFLLFLSGLIVLKKKTCILPHLKKNKGCLQIADINFFFQSCI